MKFDKEGHVCVSPEEFEQRLRASGENDPQLVSEVLLPGTPAFFATYVDYCRFLKLVADEVGVHPSSVVVCGSVKLGFSTSPRSGKIWRKWYGHSDIDLAIVDPDHYHLLDTEIRRWERTSRTNWGELRSLRDNRGACCFRHDVLPDAVPVIKHYKDAMAKIRDFCGHPITAFFFRDWWSFSGKREYDLSELREKLIAEYLPRAGAEPRVRENFSDDDLRIREDVDREELCLSEMNDITNDGLLQLKRFGQLKRLWLDDMDGITGEGIDALCALSELEWLAICSRSTAFQAKHLYVLGKLPKLKTLFVDGKLLRKKGVRNELSTRLPNVTICER